MKKQNFILALVLVTAGIALVVISLFMPPLGAISASVVEATGLVLSVAGGLCGLVLDFDFKRLRFFVGLPEQYAAHQQEQSGKHETTTSGLPDSPETP